MNPSSPPPPTRAQLARDRILEALGPGSSHPSFAPRKLKIARRLAMIPILIAIGFLAWRCWLTYGAFRTADLGVILRSAGPTIQSILSFGPRLLVAASCFAGALLAVSLTIRASAARSRAGAAHSGGIGWTGILLGLGVTVAVCIGIAWSSGNPRIQASTREWIVFGSLLPLYLLIASFEWLAPSRGDRPGLGRFAGAIAWTVMTPLALASAALAIPRAASFLSDGLFKGLVGIAGIASGNAIVQFLMAMVEQKVHGLITQFLAMGTALLVVLFACLRVSRLHRETIADIEGLRGRMDMQATESAGPIEPAKPGCLGGFLRRLGFGDHPPGGSAMATAAIEARIDEEWADSLVAEAASTAPSVQRIASAPDVDPADAAGDPLDWLFASDGLPSSEDQRELLRAFQDRWAEHLRAVERNRYGNERESHPDLLVEAEEGSGDESAVAACAIFACAARGQRVLLLEPDRDAVAHRVNEMRRLLAAFGFDTLYHVESLDRDTVTAWCPPANDPHAAREGCPPDIAVATLEDYEQVLLGPAFDRRLLRAFQISLEVVLVERIDRLVQRDQMRLHLPFLIDKHRLMLAADNRPMQLVLTTAPLGPRPDPAADRAANLTPARRKIAERFLGGDGGLDGARRPDGVEDPDRIGAHIVYLRRRSSAWPHVLLLQCLPSEGPALRAKLTLQLLGSDAEGGERRNVVLVLLAPPSEPSPLAGPEVTELIKGHRIRRASLAKIREPGSRYRGGEWYILDRAPTSEELRAAAETAGTLGARLVAVLETPEPTLPVFPVASAPALFLPHLRSAVVSLPADTPMHREEFARFGLEWNDAGWRLVAGQIGAVPTAENWSIELDGGLTELLGSETTPWPAVLVRREPGCRRRGVDTESPPRSGSCFLPRDHLLEPAEAPARDDPRRFATWITRRGLHLGRTDLAYFRPIVWDGARQAFRALRLESREEGVLVEAEPFDPSEALPRVPVRQTRLTVSPDSDPEGPYLLRTLNAYLFRMRERTHPCRSEERIVGLATPGRPGEPMQVRPIAPIEFSLETGITVIALGGRLPKDGFVEFVRSRYEGRWDTSTPATAAARPRDPWHALTRAFNFAIGVVSPSLLRFMNAYGFRPPRDGGDGATILVVEPAATAGTAVDAITSLLDDPGLRGRFLAAFRKAAGDGLRWPSAARVDGDASEDPAASAPELLRLCELLEIGPVRPFRMPEETESLDEDGAIIEPPIETGPEADPHPRRQAEIVPEANARWRDPNVGSHRDWALRGPGVLEDSPEFGIRVDVPESLVISETAAFGWHDTLDPRDQAALRAACVRVYESVEGSNRWIKGPDYEAMIVRNVDPLRPVAERIVALAGAAGLAGPRAITGLVCGLVQSFRYELQRDGNVNDGKYRFGVQMPVATLVHRAGDCDSVAILVAALLRAGRIARSGIVLVEEADGGHAMAAAEIPAVRGDICVRSVHGHLVMIEATGPFPLGFVDPTYCGRHVRLVAFGA